MNTFKLIFEQHKEIAKLMTQVLAQDTEVIRLIRDLGESRSQVVDREIQIGTLKEIVADKVEQIDDLETQVYDQHKLIEGWKIKSEVDAGRIRALENQVRLLTLEKAGLTGNVATLQETIVERTNELHNQREHSRQLGALINERQARMLRESEDTLRLRSDLDTAKTRLKTLEKRIQTLLEF